MIHFISTGAGAQLIDRALQSVLSCYGANWRTHEIGSLQAWELENAIFDTEHLILTGCETALLESFIQSYSDFIDRLPAHWWQILPPSVRQWESLVPTVLAATEKYPSLEATFLLSREFDGEIWKGIIAKVSPEIVDVLGKKGKVVMLPDLDLDKLRYTTATELARICLVMPRVDRQTNDRVRELLSVVIDSRRPIFDG